MECILFGCMSAAHTHALDFLADPSMSLSAAMATPRWTCPYSLVMLDFSADLTIMEEGTELLGRLKANKGIAGREVKAGARHEHPPLPMFTSCCPG